MRNMQEVGELRISASSISLIYPFVDEKLNGVASLGFFSGWKVADGHFTVIEFYLAVRSATKLPGLVFILRYG